MPPGPTQYSDPSRLRLRRTRRHVVRRYAPSRVLRSWRSCALKYRAVHADPSPRGASFLRHRGALVRAPRLRPRRASQSSTRPRRAGAAPRAGCTTPSVSGAPPYPAPQ
jgi:hypothetical protein